MKHPKMRDPSTFIDPALTGPDQLVLHNLLRDIDEVRERDSDLVKGQLQLKPLDATQCNYSPTKSVTANSSQNFCSHRVGSRL